jgi:hypothetical protein
VTSETATNGLECTEMVLSKPHGYYSLIIVSSATVWYCHANASAVRHSNADKERLRRMRGHPTVGGEQPLCSNADHGSYSKCHARGKGGRGKCRLYQLPDEASGLQHTGDDDDDIARSQDATRLSSRPPDWCLRSTFWRLLLVLGGVEVPWDLVFLSKMCFDSEASSAS